MIVNSLLYLAFGDETYLLEARYSILTALSYLSDPSELKLILYTDQPDYFNKLPIEIHSISTSEIDSLKGPYQYFARPKLVFLRNTLEQNKGKIIFIDTDTYFIKSPIDLFTSIADNSFVLHKNEGDLFADHGVFADKLKNKLPSLKLRVSEDEILEITPGSSPYWNSGTIGLDFNQIKSLDQTINIIDQFDPALFGPTIEQLFLGLVFRSKGQIIASENYVTHYWDKWPRKGQSPRSWTHSEISRIFEILDGKDLKTQLEIVRTEQIRPMPESSFQKILKILQSLYRR